MIMVKEEIVITEINHGKRGIRRYIPFTLKGIFFFILSVAIFCMGIIRADLAALFWGCGFLLLSCYSFIGSHLFKGIIKKQLSAHQQVINICFADNGLFPGSSTTCHIDTELPGFFIPGFTVKLVSVLTWHTREPVTLEIFLIPGKNGIELPFGVKYRGKYTCKGVTFVIEDLLGFTKTVHFRELEEYISVFPELNTRDELMVKVMGEESTDMKKSKKSNDELLEVKKYYPGDDIRRLNWKVFAHSRELFVRKGEETPPPDSKFVFILDPTLSPYISSSFHMSFLDSLVEAVCSIMMQILDAGNMIYLSIPGNTSVLTYSLKQKRELYSYLASVWWIGEQTTLRLPQKQKMHGLVFTSPGSLSLPHVLKVLHSREWNMSVFFKNYIFPDQLHNRFRIKDLFFLSDEKREYRKKLRSDMLGFKQALYSELEHYKMPPWRIRDVREI